MKKLGWVLRVLLSAALIAFLVLAPGYLQQALGRNPYHELLSGEKEPWSGVITIWHIVGFKTYQGSITAYLESCAASYEKAHPGVYVEVLGMDLTGMEERLARGETPHVWSFPSGALYAQRLSPLELGQLPGFVGNLAPAVEEGNTYAVPYLYSGYFLLGNTIVTQDKGLTWPHNQEEITGQLLQQALDMAGGKGRAQLCASELFCAMWELTGVSAPEGDFNAGQVALRIGDARTCGDLARKQESGGFTFDALPLPNFTDQVQYIGVDAVASGQAANHAQNLIRLLLEPKAQGKTAALGAMPAVQGVEASYTIGTLQALAQAYGQPQAPDPFLWQRHKQALLEEAARAMSGDTQALKAFQERLEQVMGG